MRLGPPRFRSVSVLLATIAGGLLRGVAAGSPPDIKRRELDEVELLPRAPGDTKTPGQLRLTENSGVCENTTGVYQASGYGDLDDQKSIWFWYFAARKDSENAPLALWFGGGPGTTSLQGALRAQGPCRIDNKTIDVTPNPFSWNNDVNMLYIDQPVGTGMSTGPATVGTTPDAARDVWAFLQIFLNNSKFNSLKDRPMGIWTESYGGHYGPGFAEHIMAQNDAIASGDVQGIPLNLKVLGIGNGYIDPLIQYESYMAYASGNPYHPTVSQDQITKTNETFYHEMPPGCRSLIAQCYARDVNEVCARAQDICNGDIVANLIGPYNPYFILNKEPDDYPPSIDAYVLQVAPTIGADRSGYSSSNLNVYIPFVRSGDWMRSYKSQLERVIDGGIKTILYNGDADLVANYIGVERVLDALNTTVSDQYRTAAWQPFTVAGVDAGQYKTAGNLSYLRVYGAGHEVAAYSYGGLGYGQAAQQMFSQAMRATSFTATTPSPVSAPAPSQSTQTGGSKRRNSVASVAAWLSFLFIPIFAYLL